ncbi:MAG: RNA 2',3'-cyclic phosphodiesterase [Gammaproteobacteria bacterium]|jgi:2'-5' RNA ligase
MDKKIRAFYAIELNDEVRNAALQIIDKLKQNPWAEHVRWAHAENLHLTVRFLGEISNDVINMINNDVEQKLKQCEPFTVKFKEPRLFPHFKKPRVVAVIAENNDALINVAEILENSAIAAGLAPETRQFKGHLTLGRCKKTFPKRTKIESMPFSASLDVNSVALYQSDLSNEGPTYYQLANVLFD